MLLETQKLSKTYIAGFLKKNCIPALKGVDIKVERGETVGIFGESGSGKTTLINLIAGVFPPTSGEALWENKPVQYPYQGRQRRDIQVLYQHPEDAFDPAWTLRKSILEPFRVHKLPWTEASIKALLEEVGLYEEHLNRTPRSLSGGELQRAALARVMTLRPKLLLLDEPTSMLDSISQAQVLQILRTYQEKYETAFLLVSHNIEVVHYLCRRCYFIESGRIVREEVYSDGSA